jgi:hypothetical protein
VLAAHCGHGYESSACDAVLTTRYCHIRTFGPSIHHHPPPLCLLRCHRAVRSATLRSYFSLTMPAQSSLTSDEKNKLKATLNVGNAKIVAGAFARIYYAHPDPQAWAYSGFQGALALVKDQSKGAFFMRLVDTDGTRGQIWEHELYDDFELYTDRPYFFSFPGDVSISKPLHLTIHLISFSTGMYGRPRLFG